MDIFHTEVDLYDERSVQDESRMDRGSSSEAGGTQPHGQVSKRKRAHNACTGCRQQKLRCDSTLKFPAPCSRCVARGESCVVDLQFKRTPKRHQLKEVSRQLETMRGELQLRAATQTSSRTSDVSPQDTETDSQESTVDAVVFPVYDVSALPTTIGGAATPVEVITELFKEFEAHYHPHLPIVNTSTPIENIFQGRLLFLTILFIASCHHPVYSELRSHLEAAVDYEVRSMEPDDDQVIVEFQIQALLLLSLWPPTFSKISTDGSWMRVGMAKNLALQHGFHRPNYTQEFKQRRFSAKEVKIRTMTWLACFIANYEHTSKLGIPPTITPDYTILNPPPDLHPMFKSYLLIASRTTQYLSTLGNSPLTPTGLLEAASRATLVGHFDQALQTLTLPSPLPPETAIHLLTARLFVQAFALSSDIRKDPGIFSSATINIVNGFHTAMSLLTTIHGEWTAGRLIYYPRTPIIKSLVIAALWLLNQLIANSVPAQSLDNKEKEAARNRVRDAYNCLQAISLPNAADEAKRAAMFLQALCMNRAKNEDTDRSGVGSGEGAKEDAGWGTGDVKTQTRMGTGLFYDAIWEKKVRDGNLRVGANSNSTRPRREPIIPVYGSQPGTEQYLEIPSSGGPIPREEGVADIPQGASDMGPFDQEFWAQFDDWGWWNGDPWQNNYQ